ncbi:MAG: glycosyltransferase family 2 protein [Methanobacteriaceae archaeon]|nr:glycosyltransferase family 2 protein [Methanobacteriaceae archaeon]
MKLSVVIPALNEEGIVGKTVESVPLKKLSDAGFETEIIVVDNASEDNTSQEAMEAGAKVVCEKNRGYGNAYLRGFREASGDIIVMGDADGTYPFDEILEFIQPILKENAEFVMGSRLKGNIKKGAMPALHRYIGNPFLTWVLNALFHTGISDAHCGMRAMTKEAWNKMDLKTPGMEFASEMVIEASRKNLRISEVPITYYPREGESKLSSFSDGWRHLRFMMMYRPGPFLFIPGIIVLMLGILLTGVALFQGISRMHSLILGGLLLLIGYQMLLSWLYFGAFGASYGIYRKTSLSKKIMNYHSLEKELIIGVFFLVFGVLIGLNVLYNWATGGFGALYQVQSTVIAMILSILGIQTIFSGMFLSLLLLNQVDESN